MDTLITVGYLIVLLLPFFLVRRWKGGGFVLAVLIQWAAIYPLSLWDIRYSPQDELALASHLFPGFWVALGWLYSAVYCLAVLGGSLVATGIGRLAKQLLVPWKQSKKDTQPEPQHAHGEVRFCTCGRIHPP
jgi:hypothetical protein